MDTSFYRLKHKLEEVYFVEPNDLGWPVLTRWYKRLTAYLKSMPFILIIPWSIIVTIGLYVVVGALLVRLASILQYGF